MGAVYTPEELAVDWKITTKVIEERLRAGELRGFKVGRRWRITEEAAEEYKHAGALTSLSRGGGGHSK